MFIVAVVVLAAGSGAIDAALNAFAARQFNARQITWLHAVYGLGAAAGPLLFLATTAAGLSWRWAFALVAGLQAVLTVVFALTSHLWQAPQRPQPPSSRPPRANLKDEAAPSGRGLVRHIGVCAADWSGVGHSALGVPVPHRRARCAIWSRRGSSVGVLDRPAPWTCGTGAGGHTNRSARRAGGLSGRDGRGCIAAAVARIRGRRWHRVVRAVRRTDVPALDPHHTGACRSCLDRPSYWSPKCSVSGRISNLAGPHRTAHWPVRIPGYRTELAGTRPAQHRGIRVDHLQISTQPPHDRMRTGRWRVEGGLKERNLGLGVRADHPRVHARVARRNRHCLRSTRHAARLTWPSDSSTHRRVGCSGTPPGDERSGRLC